MRLPLNEMQKAIITRLGTDMPSTPVYSPLAPADAARPFMTVSSPQVIDVSPKGPRDIYEFSYTVHVWSDIEGSWQAINTLMSQAASAIDRQVLTLENGFQEVLSRLNSAQVNPEVSEAGIVQHGTLFWTSRVVDLR